MVLEGPYFLGTMRWGGLIVANFEKSKNIRVGGYGGGVLGPQNIAETMLAVDQVRRQDLRRGYSLKKKWNGRYSNR